MRRKEWNSTTNGVMFTGGYLEEETSFKSDNSHYDKIKIKKLSKEEALQVYKDKVKLEFQTAVVKCKIRKKESLANFENHMFEESYYTELMNTLISNNIEYQYLKNSSVQDFIDNEMKIQSELFEIEECPIYYLSVAFLRVQLNEMDNDINANNFKY